MTPQARRQSLIVGAAAVAIVLLVVARPYFSTTAGSVGGPSNRSVKSAQTAPAVPVVDLQLERLQQNVGELAQPDRDPFHFRPKPAPPAPARVAAPPPITFAPPPAPTGPPPPPPIPVKFFGVLTLGGERVGAFVDARGNTFHGKEGDIIEGRYRIIRIATDTVEMAYLDGRGRQVIRLTGQ